MMRGTEEFHPSLRAMRVRLSDLPDDEGTEGDRSIPGSADPRWLNDLPDDEGTEG
jgi:hypothetical protein